MRRPEQDVVSTYGNSSSWSREQIEAFRRRQREDLRRFEKGTMPLDPRKLFHEREAAEEHGNHSQSQREIQSRHSTSSDHSSIGEETWRDAAGDRLNDFGVDEKVEFYDEDDMPLARFVERQNRRI